VIRALLLLRLRLLLIQSLPAALLGGCASYGSHLSATPVRPGDNQAGVHADAVLMDRGFGPEVLPNPELGFRVGYSENVDFGGRVNVGGFELNSLARVQRSKHLDVAVSPYLGAGFVPATNRDTGVLRAPLGMRALFGWHASDKVDVIVGLNGAVEAQAPLYAVSGQFEDVRFLVSPGCSLGSEIPWGDSLRIHPELTLTAPYDPADRGPYDGGPHGFQKPIVQGGFAFKWLTF
jgi:hypothetical protein